MHGRTKSFFEDLFVLLLLLLTAGAIYFFFFNNDEVKPSVTQNVNTLQIEQEKNDTAIETTPTIKLDSQSNETVQEEQEETQNNPSSLEENIKETNLEQNANEAPLEKKIEIIEKKEQNAQLIQEEKQASNIDEKTSVDLQVLQKFLVETKQKIKEKIVFDSIETDNSNFLSIRITVLKNGTYEQLTFIDGNKIIFDNNIDTITSIFPLTIDKKIQPDFPRYLRYRFEFSVKEQ